MEEDTMVKNSWKTMYMYEQYRNLWAKEEPEPSLKENQESWEELSQEEREYYIRALDVVTTIEMLGFTPSKELVENVMKEYGEKKEISYITRDEQVHAEFMKSAFVGSVTGEEIDERRETLITSRLNNIPVPMPVFREMNPPNVETFGLDISCNLGNIVTVDRLFDRCIDIDSFKEMAEIKMKEPEPKKKSYRQEVRQFLNKGKRW
jgi:hypothetical protein